MSVRVCAECELPDLHDGQGDGIGSCECPRCEWCGAVSWECGCASEDDFDWWLDPAVVYVPRQPTVVTVDTRGLT